MKQIRAGIAKTPSCVLSRNAHTQSDAMTMLRVKRAPMLQNDRAAHRLRPPSTGDQRSSLGNPIIQMEGNTMNIMTKKLLASAIVMALSGGVFAAGAGSGGASAGGGMGVGAGGTSGGAGGVTSPGAGTSNPMSGSSNPDSGYGSPGTTSTGGGVGTGTAATPGTAPGAPATGSTGTMHDNMTTPQTMPGSTGENGQ